MPDKSDEPVEISVSKQKKLLTRKKFKLVIIIFVTLILVLVSYASYFYTASPEVIRNPKLEHYHFRMQILVDGKAENFAENKYQQDYAKNQCNANLPEQPIHFHDDKDQFTHIHWNGMTGGMVMKYYGWNYIGGINKALGYKLDNLKDIQKVNTHGNFLPTVPDGAEFFIYTGDENTYQEKSFDDWKNQDLEQFFKKASNFPGNKEDNEQSSFWDKIFPKAYAHGGIDDGHEDVLAETLTVESEEEKLTRINNLIGNVVIFVQQNKPSDQQIKDRFSDLEPLSNSTCGG